MIDADNVSPKYIKYILDEIATYGTPTYKRIYGDWTKPQLVNWKSELLEYSIIPIQQYSYTTGKNSTDSALIIDAMDILYSGNVDGFCIVSSDSDFSIHFHSDSSIFSILLYGFGFYNAVISIFSICSSTKLSSIQ